MRLLGHIVLCHFILASPLSLATNQNQQDSVFVSEIKDSIHDLRTISDQNSFKIENLKERVDNLIALNELTSGTISNSLNASNRVVEIFSIILSLVALGLGLYVTWMERKITTMRDEVNQKEQETKELVRLINQDINGLYERIRRADIVAVLNRLIQVPRDISNLEDRLLSCELYSEDFDLLKQAYMKLVNNGEEKIDDRHSYVLGPDYDDRYHTVFFQHFLGKAIIDSELRDKMIAFFPDGMRVSFLNDIEKSTRDLAEVLVNKKASIDREEILLKYRQALNQSKYKDHTELKECLRSVINDNELWDSVEKRLLVSVSDDNDD